MDLPSEHIQNPTFTSITTVVQAITIFFLKYCSKILTFLFSIE